MCTVLVVDDDLFITEYVADVLREAGHAVIPGRIGKAVRADLEAGGYDLVLTDLNMPGMNGWDIAAWLKSNRPGMPVIAISGRMVADLDPGWISAFNAVLPKPLDEARLVALVEQLSPGAA